MPLEIGNRSLAPLQGNTSSVEVARNVRSTEQASQDRTSYARSITQIEYGGLDAAFVFMNDELFRAELPAVLLTLQRKTGSGGYFGANRFSWRNGNDIDRKHEIALNPDGFVGRSDEWIVSVLVHEQCHLLQFVRGEAPKRHYHNKGFASIMLGIGLMPSNTGAVGGKTTGIHMSHYILPDGPFAKAFAKLAASGWKLNLQSAPIIGREGGRTSKTKFSCPQCGLNVWGKPDTHVICGVCLQSGAPDSAALLEPLRLRAVR